MNLQHGPQNTTLRHLDFSPNGTLLATTGFDGQVRIWDVSAGKELANLPGNAGRCTAVDFSPDGTRLVSGHVNPGKVTLWNTETWEPIRNLQGPTQGIFWVTYSPNEELIAAAGLDRKIFLWDAQTGEPQPFPGLGLEEGNIDGLDFSPDSEWMGISFGGSRLGQVWIVDVATGEVIKRFQGPQSDMRQVAFSPDGTQLAAGLRQTKEILIWEVQTGELLQRLRGHREDVLSLAFSPDGNRVFSGGADDSVRVWDVGSGEELLLVDTLAGDSWGVAVSPDGRTVAAVHEFGDVYVWKTTLPPQTQRLQRIQEQQKKAARVQRLFTQGRWSELVPYYLRVVTEDFDNTEAHMQAAAVLSAARDREGYREVCNRMIEHFSVQRSVALYLEAERTTKACLILPDVIEPSRVPLHGFADPMDNGDTPDWFFPYGALTRALVALRSGDPEEALRWAKDAEERSPTPIIQTDCKLVQAIAYHRLGRSSEAMDALAEGTSSLQDLSRVLEEQIESPSWHDLLYAQSLQREAAALVEQP
jgi:Tol biopolymer transport system component